MYLLVVNGYSCIPIIIVLVKPHPSITTHSQGITCSYPSSHVIKQKMAFSAQRFPVRRIASILTRYISHVEFGGATAVLASSLSVVSPHGVMLGCITSTFTLPLNT